MPKVYHHIYMRVFCKQHTEFLDLSLLEERHSLYLTHSTVEQLKTTGSEGTRCLVPRVVKWDSTLFRSSGSNFIERLSYTWETVCMNQGPRFLAALIFPIPPGLIPFYTVGSPHSQGRVMLDSVVYLFHTVILLRSWIHQECYKLSKVRLLAVVRIQS